MIMYASMPIHVCFLLKTCLSVWLWQDNLTCTHVQEDIVKRFDGKGMAVVGFEIDQVRRTDKGISAETWNNLWYCQVDSLVAVDCLRYGKLGSKTSRNIQYQNLPNSDACHACHLWLKSTGKSSIAVVISGDVSVPITVAYNHHFESTMHLGWAGREQRLGTSKYLKHSLRHFDIWLQNKVHWNTRPELATS